MSGSAAATETPGAVAIAVTDEALTARPGDGRSVSAPLARFPRLVRAAPAGPDSRRLRGSGDGAHRPALGGDVGAEGLPAGCRPTGSGESFRRRPEAKRAGRPPGVPSLFPERCARRAAREA